MNNPEQIIDRKGYYAAPIHGTSMNPLLLEHRDCVYLKKTDQYNKYDVVLFRRKNNQLVLHRIIGMKNEKLIIRGDYDLQREIVDPAQCIGTMVQFTRNNKTYSADHGLYRLYGRIWNSTTLFRRLLRFFRRVKRFIITRIG